MVRLPWRRGTGRSAPASPVASVLAGSRLFDETWVSAQAGRALDRDAAIEWYLENWATGVQPHPLVDPLSIRGFWSHARLTRLREAEPLTAWLKGRFWGTPTHPLFDVATYLEAAPEAREHPEGPTGHYLEVGFGQGLRAARWLPAGERLDQWLRAAVQEPRAPSVPSHHDSLGPCEVAVSLLVDSDLGSTIRLATSSAAAGLRVVVDPGSTTPVGRAALAALPLIDPLISVGADTATTAPWTLRLRGVRSLPAGTDWWRQLWAATEAGADQVAPLLVSETGQILTAGRAVTATGSAPFLTGFAADEAAALAGVEFKALDQRALLVRTSDRRDPEAAALTRRLVPGVRVVVRQAEPATTAHDLPAPEADEIRLWARLGFTVDSVAGVPRSVHWSGTPTTAEPRPLRWAIKNPAVSGIAGDLWGDTHFADSLAGALRRRGHHVVIDRRGDFDRATGTQDHVSLLLRGRKPWQPPTGRATVNLAWVISHPDEVEPSELQHFDRVFAASQVWAQDQAARLGVAIEPLLQATDPDRFARRAHADSDGPVLFVGSTRGEFRAVVRDAIEGGLPVAVYGGGWRRFVPASVVQGDFVANDRLADLYNGARVVLNDHWEDMRRDGFLSNRLFDAVAAGARVITDDVAGLGGLFGDTVQVYRTVEELAALALGPDLDAVFGTAEEREQIAVRIRSEHSFDARAGTLSAAAHHAIAQRLSP